MARSQITAVIPVSPIKSHPETNIIEETVSSVRHHLPTSEVLITFDGVRPEQEERRADYEEHIRRTLWLADKAWGNVCPFIFEEHQHQSGMMRAIIDEIRTPLLLYVEQDTPLVVDEPIDWQAIAGYITGGHSDLIRLHHEGRVPAEHQHMMHGFANGFLRTSQWSQRPHVASVAFYRRVLEAFSPEAKCFIEDKMHSVADEAFKRDGLLGWRQWALHIYHPDTGNIKRSYHTDGRAGESKYDDTQVF